MLFYNVFDIYIQIQLTTITLIQKRISRDKLSSFVPRWTRRSDISIHLKNDITSLKASVMQIKRSGTKNNSQIVIDYV